MLKKFHRPIDIVESNPLTILKYVYDLVQILNIRFQLSVYNQLDEHINIANERYKDSVILINI